LQRFTHFPCSGELHLQEQHPPNALFNAMQLTEIINQNRQQPRVEHRKAQRSLCRIIYKESNALVLDETANAVFLIRAWSLLHAPPSPLLLQDTALLLKNTASRYFISALP